MKNYLHVSAVVWTVYSHQLIRWFLRKISALQIATVLLCAGFFSTQCEFILSWYEERKWMNRNNEKHTHRQTHSSNFREQTSSSENWPQDLIKYGPFRVYWLNMKPYASNHEKRGREKHFVVWVQSERGIVSFCSYFLSVSTKLLFCYVMACCCWMSMLLTIYALRIFFTHTLNFIVNPSHQNTTKLWTVLFLSHITSHAHQKATFVVFVVVVARFKFVLLVLLLFLVNFPYKIFRHFDTQHNGFQSSVYANIGVCLNSFESVLEFSAKLEIGLKCGRITLYLWQYFGYTFFFLFVILFKCDMIWKYRTFIHQFFF